MEAGSGPQPTSGPPQCPTAPNAPLRPWLNEQLEPSGLPPRLPQEKIVSSSAATGFMIQASTVRLASPVTKDGAAGPVKKWSVPFSVTPLTPWTVWTLATTGELVNTPPKVPLFVQLLSGPAARTVASKFTNAGLLGPGVLAALFGSEPETTSCKSGKVSLSLSGFNGLVPVSFALTNVPVPVSTLSDNPSPSVSASRGLVGAGLPPTVRLTSAPSLMPSPSVSAMVGLGLQTAPGVLLKTLWNSNHRRHRR